jgi:6-pyruvoyltetrahydropterin/6-carboxytetrahydropterin synthase
MRAELTRRVRFDASHRYQRPEWTAAENRAAFGPASEDHGHRYTCAVTLEGKLGDTGALVDLVLLDALLAAEVTARLDGRHINQDIPEFAYGKLLPTCEALARWIWDRLELRLPQGVRLAEVRVAEDDALEGACAGPA